ncbi:lymphoid-restricted membrane protein [Etheostoma spectabile]|uniref:lymphoid-restricted membrane protein n=1 Tax=Etheostoma spectabile TaxID=54343 RepID=UPI0013AF8465|nr:lymphoid-restricted membrane protein-like [Etheostoma spectabile]XP_032376435.1 lymphoid-restricted membrane protein-like [Etheostoma spectabile]
MNSQPDAETTNHLSTMLGSQDSDEETNQEEPSITNWNELSIIERVGLNSVEMSEKDLETAFCQIALAFRCDQYTLKQRLQAEEHARNLAEENIQLELTRGRETLETLKGLCLDSKRSMILQRLQLSLDILSGTVERISNTAEVLGAVHQEARVSHEVELMVAHVENLRRQHERNLAELEEAKKTIQQQNSCKNSIDQRASPEPEESDTRKKISHQSIRRRVSITLIPSQIQEKIKQDLKNQATPRRSFSKESFLTCPSPPLRPESSYSVDDRPLDPDETPTEAPAAELPSPPTPKSEDLPSKQLATRKTHNKKSPLETLRQRHKGKAALSKKKADKDKKITNIYQQLSASPCGSLRRHHPLAHWLYRCRWALFCTYLFVLFCVLTLAYCLWKLHDGPPEPWVFSHQDAV